MLFRSKTALAVTGKGDQQWHHEVVTVEDAVLRHGGAKGADFALVNTDDQDDIFSLIEVQRGEALPEWNTAADQPHLGPVAAATDQPSRAAKREERRKAKGK